eukprot:SAG31_NODE_5040_length_2781_cov_2.356078_2_plen_214_part_00
MYDLTADQKEDASKCPSLKYILLTIVNVGNFMNSGGRLKEAEGYMMESIIKTSDTKSPHRKGVTLLTYVAMHCMRVKPEAVNLPEDMEDVATATTFPWDQLDGDIGKIIADIKEMRKLGESAREITLPEDGWAISCQKMGDKLDSKVAKLESQVAVRTVQLKQEKQTHRETLQSVASMPFRVLPHVTELVGLVDLQGARRNNGCVLYEGGEGC